MITDDYGDLVHMKYMKHRKCSNMLMFDSGESGHCLLCRVLQGKIDEIRRADQHIGNNTAPFVQASGLLSQCIRN